MPQQQEPPVLTRPDRAAYLQGISDVYAAVHFHTHDPEETLLAAAGALRAIRQATAGEDYHDGVVAAVTVLYTNPDAPRSKLNLLYMQARDGWRDPRRCASVHPLSWVCLLPARHATRPLGSEPPMHRGLSPDGTPVTWPVTADHYRALEDETGGHR